MVDLNYFSMWLLRRFCSAPPKTGFGPRIWGLSANIVAYTIAWLGESPDSGLISKPSGANRKSRQHCAIRSPKFARQRTNNFRLRKLATWARRPNERSVKEFKKEEAKHPLPGKRTSATAFVAPTCEEDALRRSGDKLQEIHQRRCTIEGLRLTPANVVASKRDYRQLRCVDVGSTAMRLARLKITRIG
jgi:hypothetical protein